MFSPVPTRNLFNDRIQVEAAKQEEYMLKHITIFDVDKMCGNEFESFLSILFSRMGYNARVTERHDQGIDVIAIKDGVKLGIQAKRFKGNVGNSAVQEVVAGLTIHGCNKALVVTNSNFTNSAIALAKANNVELWDREVLIKHMRKFSVNKD